MSTSRSLPSASTMLRPAMCEIWSVTSSTLGCVSAGYHSLEIRTRLQPRRKSGFRRRRSAGSRTCLRRCSGAMRSAERLRLRPLGEPEHERLAAPVDGGAHGALRGREAAVQPALEARRRAVGVRQDPRRGALEDVHRADLRLDARHELDRRRAGADDRDALAGEVVLVVPLGRVEDLALEAPQPADLRHGGVAQRPGRVDEQRRRPVAARRLDVPQLALVVPRRARQLVVQAQVLAEAVACGDGPQVRPDLRLARVRPRPRRVRLGRERVQVRGHVALAARIRVGLPRAADVAGPLEDHEVLDARVLQADRHPDAGEPGTDDRDPDVARVRFAAVRVDVGHDLQCVSHGGALPQTAGGAANAVDGRDCDGDSDAAEPAVTRTRCSP